MGRRAGKSQILSSGRVTRRVAWQDPGEKPDRKTRSRSNGLGQTWCTYFFFSVFVQILAAVNMSVITSIWKRLHRIRKRCPWGRRPRGFSWVYPGIGTRIRCVCTFDPTKLDSVGVMRSSRVS